MQRSFLLGFLLPCCVAPPRTAPPAAAARNAGEEVLAFGGDLGGVEPPGSTIQVTADEVVVWGFTEVPADSRMQAAVAMVEAITRAELLRAIEVEVKSLALDRQVSGPGEEQEITVRTIEVVGGVLPSIGALKHGWRRVRRNGELLLCLQARLTIPRAALVTSLSQAAAAQPGADSFAARVVDRLAPSAADPSP